MIESHKGRKVNSEKVVYVYRNLKHKGKKVYSLKQGSLVVAHSSDLFLVNCSFKVNTKGVERIRKNKRKEVVAFVCGYVGQLNFFGKSDKKVVKFNPYLNDTFVDEHNNKVVDGANVLLNQLGVFIV